MRSLINLILSAGLLALGTISAHAAESLTVRLKWLHQAQFAGYYVANGNERNRGVEASVFGEVYKGVRVIAGATYLKAEQLDTDGGTTNGKQPVGVPSFLVNLGAEYDVPWVQGLTLSARWTHTGPQYFDVNNTM